MVINLEKLAPEIPETHWTDSWELGHVYVAADAQATGCLCVVCALNNSI